MKKSKLLVALLAAVALLASLAACSLTQVEAISFTKAPEATYTLNQDVKADQFKLEITYDNGNHREVALNDSILSVSGLVDGKLDTFSVGQKTVTVTYRGVTVTVYYNVVSTEGGSTVTPDDTFAGGTGTEDDPHLIATAENLAAITSGTADNVKYYKLNGPIKLSAYNWAPLTAEYIVLDGNDQTIQGLSITSAETANDYGLFAKLTNGTVKNVTFTGAYIDMTSANLGESCKNIGAVTGQLLGTSEVSGVIVDGAFLRGNGRVGGIAGQMQNNAAIKNCIVTNTRIVANNPVSVAEVDGEGDKVGGITGQIQSGVAVVIDGCKVENVILSATRDVGGIVGMTVTSTITNNQVIGCTIGATVAGGVREDVGTRNAGGIVGTLLSGSVTWTNNTVDGTTTITVSTLYESANYGLYVGGIRRSTLEKVITIGAATLTISGYDGGVDFDAFVDWHNGVDGENGAAAQVNAWIKNASRTTTTIKEPTAE